VFGDGTQRRAFSYIAGVSWSIAKCIQIEETVNEIYNVGTDQDYSINELAEEVQRAFGRRAEIKYLPPRKEVHVIYAKHNKAAAVFWMRLGLTSERE